LADSCPASTFIAACCPTWQDPGTAPGQHGMRFRGIPGTRGPPNHAVSLWLRGMDWARLDSNQPASQRFSLAGTARCVQETATIRTASSAMAAATRSASVIAAPIRSRLASAVRRVGSGRGSSAVSSRTARRSAHMPTMPWSIAQVFPKSVDQMPTHHDVLLFLVDGVKPNSGWNWRNRRVRRSTLSSRPHRHPVTREQPGPGLTLIIDERSATDSVSIVQGKQAG
jgi:hypothetical protein